MRRPRFAAFAGILSCVLTLGAHAQTQQTVYFIGDNLMYEFGQTPQFKAHAHWVSKATVTPSGPGFGPSGSNAALNEIEAVGTATGGKGGIVFMDAGEGDTEALDPGVTNPGVYISFATNLDRIIQTAQTYKLTLIVGTIPYSILGNKANLNRWIFQDCAAHNIPVVNIDWAMNSGVGYAASGHAQINPGTGLPSGPYVQTPVFWAGFADVPGSLPEKVPSTAGWDLIADMIQTQIILTEGYTLKGGYLGTVTWDAEDNTPSVVSGNSLNVNSEVQFTAYGQYSDGSTHAFRNADRYGQVGTWTNSNYGAMTLDRDGVGYGVNAGQSAVHFKTPGGQVLNGWTMTTRPAAYGCGYDCGTF